MNMTTIPNLSNLAHPVRRTAEIGDLMMSGDEDDENDSKEELGRGDTHDWKNLTWDDIQVLVAECVEKDLVGSVGLLIAYLKKMATISLIGENEKTLSCKWEQVHLLMGNFQFPFSDLTCHPYLLLEGRRMNRPIETKMGRAARFNDKYRENGLLKDSPEGKGLSSMFTEAWQGPGSGLLGKHYRIYKRNRLLPKAMSKLWSTEQPTDEDEEVAAIGYACRRSSEDILNTVISQKRFILEAIEDYPTIFSELSDDFKSDLEIQMIAGSNGYAPAAIASLRSMLIMTGAEPTYLQKIVRYFVKEFGPSVETLNLTDAQAIDKAVTALAAANPKDKTVQELAQELSAYINKPGGQLQKRDLEEYQEFMETESLSHSFSKRRKDQIASLIGYFGYAKVKRMELLSHQIHF
tara:strand:- start:382 stop:1602 length:1221 start_codon:yes stop_codon:yes gene_type:complete